MAKKIIALMIAVTMIACSSISAFAVVTETDSDSDTYTLIENGDSTKVISDSKTASAKSSVTTKTSASAKYKKGLAAYIRKYNPGASVKYANKIAGLFISNGKKYGVDHKVLMGLARTESNFRTTATSPCGTYKGMMQMCAAFGRNYGYKPSSLYKPEVSIKIAAKYISAMKKKFGSYSKALAAYNYGSGAVQSGNYSTILAKRVFNIRKDINRFLKNGKYI